MKFTAIILALLLSLPASAGRSFNGSTDKAQVASGSAVDLYGGNFVTLSCWVYVSSVPVSEANPCGKGSNNNGTESYYINLSQSGHSGNFGAHFFQTTIVDHNVDVFCATSISSHTWYNVVAIFDSTNGGGSGNAYIYLNGSLCAQGTGPNGALVLPGVGNPDWCFGSYATTGTPGACTTINFSGIVAEAALWNIALKANQAKALYTVCPVGAAARRMTMPPPVAYWPLTGASGTSIEPDLSGNKLNATLTGTAAANHPPCTR